MAKKKRRKQGAQQGGGGRSSGVEGRAESRRAQRAIQQRDAKKRKIMTYGGAAIGVAILLAATLILINLGGDSGSAADEPISDAPEVPEVPAEGRTMGNQDAPVTVVEYGDFQ